MSFWSGVNTYFIVIVAVVTEQNLIHVKFFKARFIFYFLCLIKLELQCRKQGKLRVNLG